MSILSQQQLHNLAMNIVGKDLEDQGYEFLGVNSKLGKNPQFVAIKSSKLFFIIVRAVIYPDNPVIYNEDLVNKIRSHAVKFKARTFYAGVGIANSVDYSIPISSDDDYVVNYSGLIEVKP
ncbi:Na(+)-translocating NADH-quinone reductase subunit F [Psychroflexus sp. ALD_RP9]|uniref:Na(+)-translocating NADH-quinone reductase subunit F n=1 Tax=Psychroflexus sp. ALD_RP9 TaxID=2777186 RepID=UPI001A8EEDA5|nr:Na(+)-translocating NADH-quinone reductase subunit F [Psychroflexus sp. ALD_RP9]QSS97614.1 Na(+)-translocating NADH-quinone reductase subunit F [Psychroflexus sp. ALD_RP9]